MQGSCSARDIPDPKEDSERPFLSISATEVTSSAATTTLSKRKVRGRLACHRRHALGRLPSVKSRSSTSEGSPNTIRHTCLIPTAKGGHSTVLPQCLHQRPSPTRTPVTSATSSMSWSTAEHRITTSMTSSSLTFRLESVSTIAPPPFQRRFQNRFHAFSPSFLFFLLVRPVHVGIIVNGSLPCIRFSIWQAVAAIILYFLVRAIDGLGGDCRRNTLDYTCLTTPRKILAAGGGAA